MATYDEPCARFAIYFTQGGRGFIPVRVQVPLSRSRFDVQLTELRVFLANSARRAAITFGPDTYTLSTSFRFRLHYGDNCDDV